MSDFFEGTNFAMTRYARWKWDLSFKLFAHCVKSSNLAALLRLRLSIQHSLRAEKWKSLRNGMRHFSFRSWIVLFLDYGKVLYTQYYIVHFCIKKVAALVLILCVPPMVFSTGQYSRWVGKKVSRRLLGDDELLSNPHIFFSRKNTVWKPTLKSLIFGDDL